MACPSTHGWSVRSRQLSNPSDDDLRSARCAPATASRLGALTRPAHHIHQPRGPAGSDEHARRRGDASMPAYNTPTPIDLAIDLLVGGIEVVAGDRADTVVTVSASNPAKAIDRRGAEETKVDFDGQRVT